MVSEFIIELVWKFIKPLLDMIPVIEFDVPAEAFTFFLDACAAVSYLLPMKDIVMMIGIIVSITMFRVIVSFIKTVWDILPVV